MSPYFLKKKRNQPLYWVVTTETGKKHSKDPIPLEKAKAQLRILESALEGSGRFVSGKWTKFIQLLGRKYNIPESKIKATLSDNDRLNYSGLEDRYRFVAKRNNVIHHLNEHIDHGNLLTLREITTDEELSELSKAIEQYVIPIAQVVLRNVEVSNPLQLPIIASQQVLSQTPLLVSSLDNWAAMPDFPPGVRFNPPTESELTGGISPEELNNLTNAYMNSQYETGDPTIWNEYATTILKKLDEDQKQRKDEITHFLRKAVEELLSGDYIDEKTGSITPSIETWTTLCRSLFRLKKGEKVESERFGFNIRTGGGIFKDELKARLQRFEPYIRSGVYQYYAPQLDAIKSGRNIFKGRFFADEDKRQQKRDIIESAIEDAEEIQETDNREDIDRIQTNLRNTPYRLIKKNENKVDIMSRQPIEHGTPISTIKEVNNGVTSYYHFKIPSLDAWEKEKERQGLPYSNPGTGNAYEASQRTYAKAALPGRYPSAFLYNEFGERLRGRETFESAPPPSPINEEDGGSKLSKARRRALQHQYKNKIKISGSGYWTNLFDDVAPATQARPEDIQRVRDELKEQLRVLLPSTLTLGFDTRKQTLVNQSIRRLRQMVLDQTARTRVELPVRPLSRVNQLLRGVPVQDPFYPPFPSRRARYLDERDRYLAEHPEQSASDYPPFQVEGEPVTGSAAKKSRKKKGLCGKGQAGPGYDPQPIPDVIRQQASERVELFINAFANEPNMDRAQINQHFDDMLHVPVEGDPPLPPNVDEAARALLQNLFPHLQVLFFSENPSAQNNQNAVIMLQHLLLMI
jgi:hypothetical protein